MAYKLDETLKEAFLKHRRGVYDPELDGRLILTQLNRYVEKQGSEINFKFEIKQLEVSEKLSCMILHDHDVNNKNMFLQI